MASSSNPEESHPPWLDLPPELWAAILHRLGALALLKTVQKVCTSWRSLCQDPSMWRSINMGYCGYHWELSLVLDKMCRHAVDLSQGQLIDMNIECCAGKDLLRYISRRSPHLKRLRLVHIILLRGEEMIEAVKNMPNLEELYMFYNPMKVEAIQAIGRSCPKLKSFKFNTGWYDTQHFIEPDLEAFAIAASMPQLRYLQLFGNKLTIKGVLAILFYCPNLETLDLRQCFNVDLSGDLGKWCYHRIVDFKLPYDPTDDYDYWNGADIIHFESSEDDYVTGFSDLDLTSGHEDHPEFSGGS